MPSFLGAFVGAIVWTIANVVYVDLRRKGEYGFGRIASFIAGAPTTLLWFLVVHPRRSPRVVPPPDEDDLLLREIRVDRELRERRALLSDHDPEPPSESPTGS